MELYREKDAPVIAWHHSRCDLCQRRNTFVCHFGYDHQLKKQNFRICKECLETKAGLVFNNHSTFARIQKRRFKRLHRNPMYKEINSTMRRINRKLKDYDKKKSENEKRMKLFAEKYFPPRVCRFMRRVF